MLSFPNLRLTHEVFTLKMYTQYTVTAAVIKNSELFTGRVNYDRYINNILLLF